MKHRSLTTLLEKLIKIGAKVDSNAECMTPHPAEVVAPGALFAMILDRIHRFDMPPPLIQRG